jgi:hypothetical protein
MKQKTSIYLDDPDREAVQKVGEYYGITSDTDVFSFSVRAVARAIANTQKEGQVMNIPTQSDILAQRKQWQVTIRTSEDPQAIPHILYGESLRDLRERVFEWLVIAQPLYIDGGIKVYDKKGGKWKPLITENNATAYREFSRFGLAIERGPEYEDRGFVDGKLRLEYIRKTLKHDQPDAVNQMLERGWHILTLELDKSYSEERTWYVLGHTEPDAF